MTRATLAPLVGALEDARERTLALVADVPDERLAVPRLRIINPILWELGHVAWFQEKWCLRRGGAPSLFRHADALYDSAAVAHDTRWELDIPTRAATLGYMRAVLDAVGEREARAGARPEDADFIRLALFHEDMHGEAMLYTRQTLAFPRPPHVRSAPPARGGPFPGDAEIPAGRFRLGAEPGAFEFVFDNEQWAHDVAIERPFRVAKAPVTESEFAGFVDRGGYGRREFWSDAGWRWRHEAGASCPLYWTRSGDGRWFRRDFDRLVPLDEHLPVLHVNAFEAEAYCRFAGRRLPTEAEWEAAALAVPCGAGLGPGKRAFPWGDAAPAADVAALDLASIGRADVGAHAAGDSAFGCRQMIGNVWEWTSSPFEPYPGFAPGPYREYSEPWFGDHRVLRGGCFATRARLLRGTWRNFYTPDRRDVFAGFRTAADAPR